MRSYSAKHLEVKSEINNLHPKLRYTVETEQDGELPFLDMKLINLNGHLSSTWYNKPTDTGFYNELSFARTDEI